MIPPTLYREISSLLKMLHDDSQLSVGRCLVQSLLRRPCDFWLALIYNLNIIVCCNTCCGEKMESVKKEKMGRKENQLLGCESFTRVIWILSERKIWKETGCKTSPWSITEVILRKILHRLQLSELKIHRTVYQLINALSTGADITKIQLID